MDYLNRLLKVKARMDKYKRMPTRLIVKQKHFDEMSKEFENMLYNSDGYYTRTVNGYFRVLGINIILEGALWN